MHALYDGQGTKGAPRSLPRAEAPTARGPMSVCLAPAMCSAVALSGRGGPLPAPAASHGATGTEWVQTTGDSDCQWNPGPATASGNFKSQGPADNTHVWGERRRDARQSTQIAENRVQSNPTLACAHRCSYLRDKIQVWGERRRLTHVQ